MIRKVILVGFLIYMLAFITTNCGELQEKDDGGIIKRPKRPKKFNSTEEIRTYLNKLSRFMKVASRLRYGRRRREVETHPIPFVLSKPNRQQTIDQKHMFENLERKFQAKAALRNYKNPNDVLVSDAIRIQ